MLRLTRALILASASPRRAQLLADAGYTFTIDAADVDESIRPGEAADRYVIRVARDKARAVAARHPADAVILSADTTVVAGGEILGKPTGPEDARRMLRLLSARTHEVLTSVVVIANGREFADLAVSTVRFGELTPDDIDWYLASGEPDGKAGAYAIQGRAARFIEWIEGSWSNVVGLPVATVARLLKQVGR